ncbi:NTP transferase domain-containing protein [Pseudomonas citronellolis]|uniref:NTP transferase domain-containing protein n=1 Tax=Pseudomonas citronellolis TaxID=53408 RepID=UPI0023E435C2|nr:NTP transferase domain-containing protein [Pseudomonas citronellolis]MDF3935639.1 NTP transferase domain-containing protein [Pseudomonas citronellolis]
MPGFPTLAVILAAGQGTRMRSRLPKVMHPVGNRPLLGHVLATCAAAEVERVAVVLGPDASEAHAYVAATAPAARRFTQHERLGTAHAVLAAEQALRDFNEGCVLVLCGDTPLLRPHTLQRLRQALEQGAAVAVAGFRTREPGGYGRLLMEQGALKAIREARDASPEELAIDLCNGGVMAFRADHCLWLLQRIGRDNAQGEYYLTDAVAHANAAGLPVAMVEVPEEEILGVNDRQQLHEAERLFQQRRRQQAMEEGVSLLDAATVYFSADTQWARDVTVEPCVVFGPGVSLAEGTRVPAFSRLGTP